VKVSRRIVIMISLVVVIAAAVAGGLRFLSPRDGSPAPESEPDPWERATGYYTLFDEDGEVLLETGLEITVGDEYIAPDNHHYRVVKVSGDRAYARLLGVLDLSSYLGPDWPAPPLSEKFAEATLEALPIGSRKKLLLVYHTHSAESYIPTSGKRNIAEGGGILKVGEAFVDELRKAGFEVIHDKTNHGAADAASYMRSRRIVFGYLKTRAPWALFDLHRDSSPPGTYRATAGGKTIARVLIVVGRQNPNMRANLSLAKRIKAVSDQHYPDLVRGIYFARGTYNQDLDPAALLFEMGTQTQPREEAERGARLWARMIAFALGVGGP